MGEIEGEIRIGTESHRLKFEATPNEELEPAAKHSTVESFLGDIHERYEDDRNRPDKMQVVADLIDYLRVETKQEEKENGDKSPEVANLTRMQDSLLNSLFETSDETQLDSLKEHIEIDAKKDQTSGNKNQEIFKAFRDFLHRPPKERTERPEQERLPDESYAMMHAEDVLITVANRT